MQTKNLTNFNTWLKEIKKKLSKLGIDGNFSV